MKYFIALISILAFLVATPSKILADESEASESENENVYVITLEEALSDPQ
jgi:hypothetical protein